jgi:hypothetical protein
MTDQDRNVTASHNASLREQAIQNALERMYQLQKEEKALIEEHIEPLREEKRDIKKRMRDQYDIPTKRFNARVGLYIEERKALENDDGTALDALRELFEVAPVGTQMNWLDGLNPQQASRPVSPDAKPGEHGRTRSQTKEAPEQEQKPNGYDAEVEAAVEEVETPQKSTFAPQPATQAWEYPDMPAGVDKRYKKQFHEGAKNRAEGEPFARASSYKPGTKSATAAQAGWRAMDAQLQPEADGPVEESAEDSIDPEEEWYDETPSSEEPKQAAEGDGYDMVDVGDPDPEQQEKWPGDETRELNPSQMSEDEWGDDVDPLQGE